MDMEVIPAPTGPSDRCARYKRTSVEARMAARDERQRLWCEEQCRLTKERNQRMFDRMAAAHGGYWQTNADGSQTLVPHAKSTSSPADMKSVPSLSESFGTPLPVW